MPDEHGNSVPHNGGHIQRQQENLQSQANKQDIAIAQLNNSICTLTGSVDKLTERIEKRIDESDRWRRDQENRVTKLEVNMTQAEQNAEIIKQQDARIVALEVVSSRMEKMFWALVAGIVTAGIASGAGLVIQLLD